MALQQIVSGNASPVIPTVLSFGKITGNGAVNVIPDEVRIEGTFRTLNEEWRGESSPIHRKDCPGYSNSDGGETELEIRHGYPPYSMILQ